MNRASHHRHLALLTVTTLALVAAAWCGFVWYDNGLESRETVSYARDGSALMAYTRTGGLCSNGPCKYPVHNLYADGTFEGKANVSQTDVARLSKIIDVTDFESYQRNDVSECASAADGTDLVIYFPQKYGDQSFLPCSLEIADDDKAFSHVLKLINN